MKSALCLFSELCFLHGRGAQFHKIHEKHGGENEKSSRESLDGKWNDYMKGLEGPENRKCARSICFTTLFGPNQAKSLKNNSLCWYIRLFFVVFFFCLKLEKRFVLQYVLVQIIEMYSFFLYIRLFFAVF